MEILQLRLADLSVSLFFSSLAAGSCLMGKRLVTCGNCHTVSVPARSDGPGSTRNRDQQRLKTRKSMLEGPAAVRLAPEVFTKSKQQANWDCLTSPHKRNKLQTPSPSSLAPARVLGPTVGAPKPGPNLETNKFRRTSECANSFAICIHLHNLGTDF